jgi:hypothetical protein
MKPLPGAGRGNIKEKGKRKNKRGKEKSIRERENTENRGMRNIRQVSTVRLE